MRRIAASPANPFEIVANRAAHHETGFNRRRLPRVRSASRSAGSERAGTEVIWTLDDNRRLSST
jgi:hypothetical protein